MARRGQCDARFRCWLPTFNGSPPRSRPQFRIAVKRTPLAPGGIGESFLDSHSHQRSAGSRADCSARRVGEAMSASDSPIKEISCASGWLRLYAHDSYVSIWLDADLPQDGVVIGTGSTIEEAIEEAQRNLCQTLIKTPGLK